MSLSPGLKADRKLSTLSLLGAPAQPITPPARRVVSQDYFTPDWKTQAAAHRRIQTSNSASPGRRRSTQDHSDVVYGEDTGDYSGLSDSSNEESDSESETDLDVDKGDIPVTGFAVASNKRNFDFHELFPSVPEGDYLIEDYGCALQRDILVHGRIYVSENHVCFHAGIFGWITNFMIPFEDILKLEKKMTAFVIPNAITVNTRQAKYTFSSLLARDVAFDLMHNIWRLACPDEDHSILLSPPKTVNSSTDLSAAAPGFPILLEGSPVYEEPAETPTVSPLRHKVTHCACGKDGSHYKETPLDAVFPGTPDRIHNLLFSSGFIKDFMISDQKLLDIQISDWSPTEAGSKSLARNMTYIKPLFGPIGPKQTKCELRDETVFVDFDNYTSTITTTRTPNVPSGNVFSVKTRTCITWASAVTTRVVITSQVDWTGRSFIKGIIESSAISGQMSYCVELEKAVRAYIHEHRTEFVPAGIDADVMEAAAQASSASIPKIREPSSEEISAIREKDQRGLQWLWDTSSAAYEVAKQSASGGWELLTDIWSNSTSTGLLYAVIFALVASNLWTIMRSGKTAVITHERQVPGQHGRISLQEHNQWMRDTVSAFWDKMKVENADAVTFGGVVARTSSGGPSWKEEIEEINSMLDDVEDRVRRISKTVNEVD